MPEFPPDPDIVFAYDTVKLVRVLDRRLGIVFYVCEVIIVVYFMIVLVGNKEYLEKEKSGGWITCSILNPQRSNIGEPTEFSWDVYDRVTNPGELGAIFIPTRIVVTKGQVQGCPDDDPDCDPYCPSPTHPCVEDADCDVGNALLQRSDAGACAQVEKEGDSGPITEGQCMRHQWCPAEDDDLETTHTYMLEFDAVEIWFETFVHFHKFHTDVATTDEPRPREYPMKKANTYPMHDIIRMAKLKPEDIEDYGAVVIMNAIFDCNLDEHQCESTLMSANVDSKTGYNHVFNDYYYENGRRKRDSYRMYGVRFIAFATGMGKKTSPPMVITQIASFIALCSVATGVADFYMTNIVPERKNYNAQKVIETEDFNPG